MSVEKFMHEIRDNIDVVIEQSTDLGRSLYHRFCQEHPADIAQFLEDMPKETAMRLFSALPPEVRIDTFPEFFDSMKALVLAHMGDAERTTVLNAISPDELTDLFDELSDDELKTYLELLRSSVREQVVSLLRFDPESAGG